MCIKKNRIDGQKTRNELRYMLYNTLQLVQRIGGLPAQSKLTKKVVSLRKVEAMAKENIKSPSFF